MSEDLLYEEIYQKTQDCGRAQFVKLLQQNQINIEQLQQENEKLKEKLEENTKIYLHTSKYVSKMEGKYIVSNYILTEIEKWLEEEKENDLNENFIVVRLVDIKNKIQELKGIVSGKI